MPTAWRLAREYRWLLKRFGLDGIAKGTHVSVSRVPTFLMPDFAVGGYDPLTKTVWLEQWKGGGIDVARLSHGLVRRAGLGEWGAYYTFARALNETTGGFIDNYRDLVKASHMVGKMRATVGLSVFLIPTMVALLRKNLVLLSIQLPIITAYLNAIRGIQKSHKTAEEVRYLRWLFKRGVKRGLEVNKEDLRRFVEGRKEELRLREQLPPHSLDEEALRRLRPRQLLALLPYYEGEAREMIWNVFMEKYGKLSPKKRARVLLSVLPSVPHWLFNFPRSSSKG